MIFVHATFRRTAASALLVLAASLAAPAHADADAAAPQPGAVAEKAARPAAAPRQPSLDHSGARRVGLASYYARQLAGRRMADGTPMRPDSDNAASRSLPLGTVAQVTNLRNGRTALVTIRDRGPFHGRGRIIDLSPATARQLGMLAAGVVRVEVQPVLVPQPDGRPDAVAALSEAISVEAVRTRPETAQ